MKPCLYTIILFLLTGCLPNLQYSSFITREDALNQKEIAITFAKIGNPDNAENVKRFYDAYKINSVYTFVDSNNLTLSDGEYVTNTWTQAGVTALNIAILGMPGLLASAPQSKLDLNKIIADKTSFPLNYPNTSLIKSFDSKNAEDDILKGAKEIHQIMNLMNRNCFQAMPLRRNQDPEATSDISFVYKRGEILFEEFLCESPLSIGDTVQSPSPIAHYDKNVKTYRVITQSMRLKENNKEKIILAITPFCGEKQKYMNKTEIVNIRFDEKGYQKGEYIKLKNYSTDACRLPEDWNNGITKSGWIAIDRTWDTNKTQRGAVTIKTPEKITTLPGPIKIPSKYIEWVNAGKPDYTNTQENED